MTEEFSVEKLQAILKVSQDQNARLLDKVDELVRTVADRNFESAQLRAKLEAAEGLRVALEQMIEAINTGNIDSPDIGGEPEVCSHSHKWHEEWLYHTREALAAYQKSKGEKHDG